MLRLIALYVHYRDLQEQHARSAGHVAAPLMRIVPASAPNAAEDQPVRALAA